MRWSDRPVWLLPVLATVICVGIGLTVFLGTGGQGRFAAPTAQESGRALIGGPFELVSHEGETVTEADFAGRPMLIYFGFTYCPDVCPMSLQVMAAALDQLEPDARAEFQTLLISVDPERDTPELLAQYVTSEAFPEGLTGLTGSPEQVRRAAEAYRVFYRRSEQDGSMAEYLVDHSSIIYFMDRQGQFVEAFPHATSPAQIARRLQRFLEEEGSGSSA